MVTSHSSINSIIKKNPLFLGLFVFILALLASSVYAENQPKFIENKGQYPEQVEFKLRVVNTDLYFERNRLTFNFFDSELLHDHAHDEDDHKSDVQAHSYRVNFLGGGFDTEVIAGGKQHSEYYNFISGEKRVGHVQAYDKVLYKNIYSGIDLEYYGSQGNLKYDVTIASGVDPAILKMEFEGVSDINIKDGKLVVANSLNRVEESIPMAYQVVNGIRIAVDCKYLLEGNVVSFEFPNGYDDSKELVIDPLLIFSSYSGSTSDNFGFTATYDAAGALYGGGIAFGLGYPTTVGAYSTAFSGLVDMSISKFSPDGTSLIYSTYIGGTSTETPHSMIINSQGQLVILGCTSSLNYPTSSNAYDDTFNGGVAVNYNANGANFQNGSDIVVSVLSADGSSLVGSTFLGGSANDGLNEDTDLAYNYGDIFRGEVIVDAADNIYIASSTESNDLPVTSGTVGQTLSGNQDACIAKFNSNVSALLWCTYLGGNASDAGYSLKLNSSNDLYVTGGTEGQSFPIVGSTLNTTFQGGISDGFLVELNNTATSIQASTYIGTSGYDQTYFVEVDHDDDVYLYGQSEGNYPIVGGVYSNANSKQFLQKLTPDLTTSVFSTVFGSGSAEVNISPTAFLVDICKRIYVSGWGGGTNNFWNPSTGTTNGMPTTNDGFQLTTDGSDFYFMVLEADASSLLYGTYFGGNGVNEHVDGGTSRFNSDGVIHQAVCAGCGNSNAFPTTPGVVSNTNNSSNCNLGVIKLDLEIPLVDVGINITTNQTGCAPFEIQFNADTLVAPDFVWYFGNGDSSLLANPTYTFTTPGSYEVLLIGTNVNCQGNQFIDTARVIVNAVESTDSVSAGPDLLMCPGDTVQLDGFGGVSYSWTPTTSLSDPNVEDPLAFPQVTTEYVLEASDSLGCSAFDTVLVTVGALDIELSPDTTLCEGDTIQITASGGAIYLWSPNTNISDVSIANPLFWPSTTTTYYLDAETADGCQGSDSIVITVQPLPIADAGVDISICLGDTTQLSASGGADYEWSPILGLSDAFVSNPLAFPTVQTDYVVVASDNAGCNNSDTVTVFVNDLPVVDAEPDQTLCLGQNAQLTATGADSYVWTPGGSLNDSTIFNPIALPMVPTDYVVEGTDASGCSATDTVFVDVFTVDAVGDTIICIGDAAQLGAIGGVSWSWTPTTGLSDATAQFPTANPTSTTVYTVIADDGTGCLAEDTVTVVVNQLPNAFAGFDQGVCAGSNAQLNATGGVTYQWAPATGLSDANISNPVVTFTSDTATYIVTVADAIGCINTDTVTVWQEPLPDAAAGPDTTICFGESIQLNSSGGQTYSWTPATGLNNPNVQNPTATPQTTTTYTVTVGQPTGNLVFNGDFSQGNVGFNSDYTYATQLNPEGLYSIVTDANTVHNAFQGTDHTGNAPLDSFMVVNGAGTPNQNVWCQTVSVSPNTDYFFGAWVSTVVASSPAILQFSINGQVLGAPFTAPFNINNWSQFFETWNSGTATTATICIVNQNTNTGGNDFGLDDITFSTFCTNTAEVTVTVNPLPEADAGEDQAICIGDVTQMDGSGGVTYSWVPPIGLTDPTDPTTDASPNITTTYTLIVEDNIGCSDTDEMILTVNPLPAANAGPDQEICIGESVILEGSGGTIYQWDPTIYLDDATAQLPVSTAEETITYTLTVTDNNQCQNTDQTTVTVNPLPIVDAGQDSTICIDGSLVLQATGAETYSWTPLVGISDPQSAAPTASPLDPTTYYVTGTDINGCVNTDSVVIDIFTVDAYSGDYIICLNDSVLAPVSGGFIYSWNPDETVSDSNSDAPYLSPIESTEYAVTVTSAFGCVDETEVTVQVLSLPIAAFSGTFDPGCDGIYGFFDNVSENSQSYYWSFGDGDTSAEFEPSHIYENGAGPTVTLYVFNNDSLCVDSITIDYSSQWFSNDSLEIDYANVFTPNYDGINDCFKPDFDGRYSDCYELRVYNRWGALIFESVAGQNHCWDGRTKGGIMVPEGTYYYISIVHGIDHAGYVTVIYE